MLAKTPEENSVQVIPNVQAASTDESLIYLCISTHCSRGLAHGRQTGGPLKGPCSWEDLSSMTYCIH